MAHASYHPGAVREKETGMRRHPHQPQPNESRLGGISVSTQSEFQRCPPISGAHFDREVLPPISRAHFVTETVPPMWRTLRPTQRALPRKANHASGNESPGFNFKRWLLQPPPQPHMLPPRRARYPMSIKGCQFQAVVAPTMVAKNRNHRERTTLIERIQFQEPKLQEKNPQDSIPSPR